jgi:hypothetical protein
MSRARLFQNGSRLQVLCGAQNEGQTAELMEDQPSRKKQRISNPNSKLNFHIFHLNRQF